MPVAPGRCWKVPGPLVNTQYQCTAFNFREDHRVPMYKCCQAGCRMTTHPS